MKRFIARLFAPILIALSTAPVTANFNLEWTGAVFLFACELPKFGLSTGPILTSLRAHRRIQIASEPTLC